MILGSLRMRDRNFCSTKKKMWQFVGYVFTVGLLLSIVLVRTMAKSQIVLIWGDDVEDDKEEMGEEWDVKPDSTQEHSCDCPTTNGETELQQLSRYVVLTNV